MLRNRWVKVVVFVLCLLPVLWLAWRGWHQDLSANPIEFITRYTGDWTLRFLVLTLAVTPLRKLLGLPDLIKFRRMIGLYAFFYGVLHFTTYIWLDKFFDLAEMLHDVAKRPFITAGFTAFLLMIPLAVSAPRGLHQRCRRRGPLLLAGEERYPPACALRQPGDTGVTNPCRLLVKGKTGTFCNRAASGDRGTIAG
jgi:methionine sulfoxide reductase heme-binding subunit